MRAIELGAQDRIRQQAEVIRALHQRCRDLAEALDRLLSPGVMPYAEQNARTNARRLLGYPAGRDAVQPASAARTKARQKERAGRDAVQPASAARTKARQKERA